MEKVYKAGVLTVSDKCSRGERKDDSGVAAARILEKEGFCLAKKKIVPDNIQQIADTLIEWVDNDRLSLIVTSGGTGLSPTDVTPQAMEEVIDYKVPGIAGPGHSGSHEGIKPEKNSTCHAFPRHRWCQRKLPYNKPARQSKWS